MNASFPKNPEPLWRKTTAMPHFPSLTEDIHVDVAVVGAGMTGIATAYLLAKEGVKAALFDAGEIANGTSGHTTAKITAQHGLIYDELIGHFGKEMAETYYKANEAGAACIEAIVKELGISCDYSHQDAYIYANRDQDLAKLEKEWQAYQTLGIKGEWLDSLPVDISVKKAIKMEGQAQFDPLAYLKPLVTFLAENNVPVFENTTAKEIEYGKPVKIKTDKGHTVSCNTVCVCTHFPFCDAKGLYYTRMYPNRSYLIAVKPVKPFPGGMYINAGQPVRSLRGVTVNGEKLLLVGGENHKTGEGEPMIQHYEALQDYAEKTFGIEKFYSRWSAQDLTTLDKVPFIGPITKNEPNVLIATGFRKWGMTSSHLAAMIMRDKIVNKPNPYFKLFSPQRFEGDPMVKKFLSTNLDVAGHFIEGKLDLPDKSLQDLQQGESAIVRMKGKRAGAYKDEDGKIHVLDTTCTHLGCEVNWNSGDRTWDCPCHGSRFSYTGEVIEGPAKKPLKKIAEE
ncbi:FAD-dependent oxidoreductase [Heyndrickxia acidiproducens]|uniref:FAD-dependent oxidoreductase n=1 Tax=Heyndrickxia acidiproducens TaxID=1121084 RepID=UPI00037BCF0A|nr:FAD-dependent oxidoreductase [Heyndrickxia acidiproducens]